MFFKTLTRYAETPFRLIFGEDVFISYARADGITYAEGLASQLAKREFACRVDMWDTSPGAELPKNLVRALRWSKMLVLVGTPAAAKSGSVALEIEEFVATGGAIVPVDFGGSIDNALWYPKIKGLPLMRETNADALVTGKPSEAVISRIENSIKFKRRNQRMRRIFVTSLVAFLILISINFLAAIYALRALAEATQASIEASRARQEAKRARDETALERARAEAASAVAEGEKQRAAQASAFADAQTKLADEAKRRADEQTKLAKAADARRAFAEQQASIAAQQARDARADAARQTRIALARRIAAQSDLAHSPKPYNLQRNMLFSIESMKLNYSLEAYRNMLAGLKTLARPVAPPMSHDGEGVRAVVFSPGGRFIATRTRDTLRLWHANTQRLAAPPRKHEAAIEFMIFSRRGKYLATASGKTVRVWTMPLDADSKPIDIAHESDVSAIAFSDDEARLAVASGNTARVLTLTPDAREVASMLHGSQVNAVAFNSQTPQLATAETRGFVQVWNVGGGLRQQEPVRKDLQPAMSRVTTLLYSPNGKYLVSLSESSSNEVFSVRVRLWDTREYEPDTSPSIFDEVKDMKFSPDGKYFVVTGKRFRGHRETVVWDISGERLRVVMEMAEPVGAPSVLGVAFSADGKFMATSTVDKTMQVWNPESGRLVAYLSLKADAYPGQFALNSSGDLLATASGDALQVWRTRTNWELARVLAGREAVVDSSDGTRLAVNAQPGVVRIKEVDSQTELANIPIDNPNGDALSRDGKLRAVATGHTVHILTAEGEKKYEVEHPHPITSAEEDEPKDKLAVAFSADGNHLLTTDKLTARMWSLTSGDKPIEVARITMAEEVGNEFVIDAATMSRDGRYIVAKGFGLLEDDFLTQVWVWEWQPEDVSNKLCARLSRGLLEPEWAEEMSGIKYQPTCRRPEPPRPDNNQRTTADRFGKLFPPSHVLTGAR